MKDVYARSLQYRLLMLLIIAASCVRVLVCFQHNPMDYLVSDMLRHWNNGIYFPRGGYTAAGDPIVYQVYIAVLHRVTRDNRLLVALASAILSVVMPWTYYRAARNFGLEKIPALWVWTLIAWTPSLFVIYHYIMMETLLLLVVGFALWMTARYLRRGGTLAFLIFVFCWTIACLTKPTVVPLAGVCFLWVWWKKRTPLRIIAIGGAMALLLLVPQAIRTKVELGFVAPFGNPWLARLMLRSGAKMTVFHFHTHAHPGGQSTNPRETLEFMFGSPSCYVRPLEPLSSWAMRRAYGDSKAEVTINSAFGERDWKQAYKQFNDDTDASEWLAQWRENIILFFFAPSWPEVGLYQWDGHLEYRCRWLWAPLILFVFVANIREFVHRRFDLIPVAVTLFTLSVALQNLVITEGRYRKPVEPLLLLNLVWVLGNKRMSTPQSEPALAEVEAREGSGA